MHCYNFLFLVLLLRCACIFDSALEKEVDSNRLFLFSRICVVVAILAVGTIDAVSAICLLM